MKNESVYSLRWRIPFPRSIAGLWVFAIGAILLVMLGVQIFTGIVLAMFYVPTAELAFDSIIHIMRAVRHGELLRNMHAIGASLFFFAATCIFFVACTTTFTVSPGRQCGWLASRCISC